MKKGRRVKRGFSYRSKKNTKRRRHRAHIGRYDFEEELLMALRGSRSRRAAYRKMGISTSALERTIGDNIRWEMTRALGERARTGRRAAGDSSLARALTKAVGEEIEMPSKPVKKPIESKRDKIALASTLEHALEEHTLEEPPLNRKRRVKAEPVEKESPSESKLKRELASAIEFEIEDEPSLKILRKKPEKVVGPEAEELSREGLSRVITTRLEEEPVEVTIRGSRRTKLKGAAGEKVKTGGVVEERVEVLKAEEPGESLPLIETKTVGAQEDELEVPEGGEIVVKRVIETRKAPVVTIIRGGGMVKPGAGKIVFEKIPDKEIKPLPKKGAELDRAIKEIITKKKIKIEEAKPLEIKLEGFPPYDPKIHGPITVPEPVEEFQSVEEYWVDEPFAYVQIMHNPKTREKLYNLVEPKLDDNEKKLAEEVVEYLKARVSLEELMGSKEEVISKKMLEFLKKHKVRISPLSAYKIYYHLRRECFGLKGIDTIMKDPNIEDISCNGLDVPVFIYHRKYYSMPTSLIFRDEEVLNSLVINLVEQSGKMISFGKPTVDATLPDGSRLQATLGREITTRGSTFTIRKFAKEPFTPVHLLKYGTYSAEMLAYLWLSIENKNNILVIGETASGKTSTLNAMAQFIPPDAKIVSLEETRELTLYQTNWIPSVTRSTLGEGGGITLYDLLLQALRQRPECIVVGEVRGKEGLTLFQAMSTGHTCYSTLHASSIEDAINRLEGAPLNIPHNMIASLDIACFQSISYMGPMRVRRAQSMVEIVGLDPETNSLRVQEVFRWVPETDTFEQTAASVKLRDIAERRGVSYDEVMEELENRARVLKYLLKHNVLDHERVSTFMRLYHSSPEEVMKHILSEKSVRKPSSKKSVRKTKKRR